MSNMKERRLWQAAFLFLAVSSTRCQVQSDLDYIGKYLDVNITIADNLEYNGKKHKFDLVFTNTGSQAITTGKWKIYFYSFFMIESDHLPSKTGYILKHYNVKLNHVQGCLFSMEPTAEFRAIESNTSRFIEFYGQNWAVSKTDIPPNWYVAQEGLNPVLIKSTSLANNFVTDIASVRAWKRYRNDQYNPYTAQERFRRHNIRDLGHAPKKIIPTPNSVVFGKDNQTIDISSLPIMTSRETESEAKFLSEKMGKNYYIEDRPQNVKNAIILYVQPSLGTNREKYLLQINPAINTVIITGQSRAGVFYGIQSLFSLLAEYSNSLLPEINIQDEPRYEFRGMHVDVARNFRPKRDLIRLMDVMAMYKLNKLHIHLSDDEGWRLEIPGLPELTEVGGNRCHDLTETKCLVPQLGSGPDNSTSGSGFYSVSDFKEIVTEAETRHIEIIPELDMPGHARAAIISMEARYKKYEKSNPREASKYRLVDPDDKSVYSSVQMFNDNAVNPCIDSTYSFIEKVINEIKKMYPGMETFHFGGDEVAKGAWTNSPDCKELAEVDSYYQTYSHLKELFAEEVSNITGRLGLNIGGWEDGLMGDNGRPYDREMLVNNEVFANAWQNIWEWGAGRRAYDLANNGYEVVVSHATHLFFDHPYEPDPQERGLYWATRYTDTLKTFQFLPDRLYDNIEVKRSGEPLTKQDVCGASNKNCPSLNVPDNVVGMQGQGWSETVMTSGDFDYMLVPRLIALAERAWHKALWEDLDKPDRDRVALDDWEAFANTLGHKELGRLDKMLVMYRLSPPGATYENDRLKLNTEFPGLIPEYSLDNGRTWSENTNQFQLNGSSIQLRTRTKDRQRISRTITFNPVERIPVADQNDIDYISQNVKVEYEVLSNLVDENKIYWLSYTFTNQGKNPVKPRSWAIYTYQKTYWYPYSPSDQNGIKLPDCKFIISHVSGSLYKLSPDPKEFNLNPKQSVSCNLKFKNWQVAEKETYPNWYVAAEGMEGKILNSTEGESLEFVKPFLRREQILRYPDDTYLPYLPRTRYLINQKIQDMGKPVKLIIPTPVEVKMMSDLYLDVDSEWVVIKSPRFPKAVSLIAGFFNLTEVNETPQSKFISIEFLKRSFINNSETSDESYSIRSSKRKRSIVITTATPVGAFYAFQSLKQITTENDMMKKVPDVEIYDQPRFKYRGQFLDVARNFFGKKDIMVLLDVMAMYKLNKFHIHLSDDEGWRIQITGLDELTEVGSNRCHDPLEEKCLMPQLGSGPNTHSQGSGYYTVQDYKDILAYAEERHIEIIPEIEIPDHSRAAIKSMEVRYKKYMKYGNKTKAEEFLLTEFEDKTRYLAPQFYVDNSLNPCIESTIPFVSHLVKHFKDMHKDIQPLKTFHFGGGEIAGTWTESPSCKRLLAKNREISTEFIKQYFYKQLATVAETEGIEFSSWSDILLDKRKNPYSIFSGTNASLYAHAYIWQSIWEEGHADQAYKLANYGYKVILAHASYFNIDHPYEPDPEERGKYWAARFIDIRKTFGFIPDDIYANADFQRNGKPLTKLQICPTGSCLRLLKPENIEGILGKVWGEYIRTTKQMQKMVFPRLLAVAERAWHKSDWEAIQDKKTRNKAIDKEYSDFINTVGYRELPRLEKMGVIYYLPPPGAIHKRGKIKVNSAIPGLKIQFYKDDKKNRKTVLDSTKFDSPQNIFLVTSSADGARTSRSIQLKVGITDTSAANKNRPYLHMSFIVLIYLIVAADGLIVVLAHASYLNLEHPYEPDPEERGNYWAARFIDTRKTFGFIPDDIYANADFQRNGKPLTKRQICPTGSCLRLMKPENIEGILGKLWGEYIRTTKHLQNSAFPRLLAVAERAWHKSDWEAIQDKKTRNKAIDKEFSDFVNTVGYRELPRLEKMGVSYYLPPPGAIHKNGKIKVNSAIPGLLIQFYKDDPKNRKTVLDSTKFDTTQTIFLVTSSVNGTRTSRAVQLKVGITDTSAATKNSPYLNMSIIVLIYVIVARV